MLQEKQLKYKLKQVTHTDEIVDNHVKIGEYLDKVLPKAPEVNRESVIANIESGKSQLWLATSEELVGIVVTTLVVYPTTKRLLIHLLGGKDVKQWVHLISEIEEWSKSKGLDGIEIQGRKGWTKLLPDYSCERVLMIKEF